MRMAGRKRICLVSLAGHYDLRPDYVGGAPLHAAPIEVTNPFNSAEKITVYRSLRDDPLARMQERRQIDDHQYTAGRHWQRAYEIAEVGGARAIDPTREAVDGGQIARAVISDAQAKAFQTLARGSKAVGMIGESVLRDVLAHGMFPEQVAQARGYKNQRSIDYYARLFRDCLETLAREFGFTNERRRT